MSAEAEDKEGSNSSEGDSTKSVNSKDNEKTDGLIRELREEAKNHRLKNKALTSEFELFKVQIEDKLKNLSTEKEKLETSLSKFSTYEKRIVESELKTQAVISGIKDPDLIKLIDVSNVKISDDGVVDTDALKSAVDSLKESKPFLFGEEKKVATSSNAKTNANTSEKITDVTKLSKSEYDLKKQSFLRSPSKF